MRWATTAADIVGIGALAAFAWVVWPPAVLLVVAATALAFSWRYR